jgi:hypothetical protein
MISHQVSVRCLDTGPRTFVYSVPQEERGTVQNLLSRIGEQHYSSPLSVSLVKNETLDHRYLDWSEELPARPSDISIYLRSGTRNVRRRVSSENSSEVALHLSLETGEHFCILTLPCPSHRVWLDWLEELETSHVILSHFRFQRLQHFPPVQELSLLRQVTPGAYLLTLKAERSETFRPFTGKAHRLSGEA